MGGRLMQNGGGDPSFRAEIFGVQLMGGRFKGQASIELLVSVGIAIAFIIPLVLLFSSSSSTKATELSKMQAKALAQQIADESAQVWYMGSGAKRTVFLNYPNNLANITVNGTQAIVTIFGEGGAKSELISSAPCQMVDARSSVTGGQVPRLTLAASFRGGRVQPGLVAIVFQNNGDVVNIYRVYGGEYQIT